MNRPSAVSRWCASTRFGPRGRGPIWRRDGNHPDYCTSILGFVGYSPRCILTHCRDNSSTGVPVMSTAGSPSQPNELDWFNAEVKAQVDLLKAWSEYNLTMMKAFELRARIEVELLKIRIIQDAFNDYRQARARLLQEITRTQTRVAKTADACRWARRYSSGQNLDPDLVPHVWIGMNLFLNDVPIEVEAELTALVVGDQERDGRNFCRNRDPDSACINAPSDAVQARDLIAHLARHSYMPRSGSPTMTYLARVVKFVSTLAAERSNSLSARVAAAQEELKEIRAMNWKNIDVSTPPKEPE